MTGVGIIGVDLAKNVFQVHGAAVDGSVVFRRKVTRSQFYWFMSAQPRCVVVMEARGGSHCWARETAQLGHEVRLIAPRYVEPFIERRKNDAADAEAIVAAALRPTMRYVEAKTAAQQSRAIVFRSREPFVSQRTEAINALRSHLYAFGYVAPRGIGHLPRLEEVIENPNSDLPRLARAICRELLDQIAQLTTRIPADHADQSAEEDDRHDVQGGRDVPPPADHAG